MKVTGFTLNLINIKHKFYINCCSYIQKIFIYEITVIIVKSTIYKDAAVI